MPGHRPGIAATRARPIVMDFGLTRRCQFTRRNNPRLREHGETMSDARAEVRRGLEIVGPGFPRSKVRRGVSIRLTEFG